MGECRFWIEKAGSEQVRERTRISAGAGCGTTLSLRLLPRNCFGLDHLEESLFRGYGKRFRTVEWIQ